jgi:hypothetical protein
MPAEIVPAIIPPAPDELDILKWRCAVRAINAVTACAGGGSAQQAQARDQSEEKFPHRVAPHQTPGIPP